MNKLKCASFFAGVGGIDLGFKNTGFFETTYANEMDQFAVQTYEKNFDTKVVCKDINLVEAKDITDFDVMLGGFPCQAFSIAGKKEGFNDSKGRGELFFQLERIFKEKQPKIIFLENVKNLLSHDNGNTFKVILDAITTAGYHVKYKVLNAAKYGNIPQGRERVYIIGFKDEQLYDNFTFPEEIPLTTTLHDIIDFKSKIDDKYYYTPEKYSFYDTLTETITSMNTTYQWRRSAFVRENKKNICFTLTASMGTGGHEVPLVLTETEIRKLTPRECFSLQGFPNTFMFPDLADSKLYKQAGNSVVVPVIERLAKQIETAYKQTYKMI